MNMDLTTHNNVWEVFFFFCRVQLRPVLLSTSKTEKAKIALYVTIINCVHTFTQAEKNAALSRSYTNDTNGIVGSHVGCGRSVSGCGARKIETTRRRRRKLVE